MCILFFTCILGVIAVIPLYFLSVEHLKLQEKYGKEKGTKIGEVYGVISGWGFFIFWFGIWFSPQPRFIAPIFQNPEVLVPVINLSTPLLHLIVFIPFFIVGAWFGIKGVKETTLQTAETHRTEKIVTTGIYSIVRHPQYFGGLLAHIGMFFLLSAGHSLLSTPLMAVIIYTISKKEEKELIKEFGKEYEDYKKKVPMLMPKLRMQKKENYGC
jgi:protein-S-isoprenylcysteine O-methyltransferase Ste14